MFMLFQIEEDIGIPPHEFGRDIKEVALEQLKALYEGQMNEELGYVILVTDVEVDPVGYLFPRDGSTYHKSKCWVVTFLPKVQEVVEGEAVEITEFGAFVRIGPVDALLHISQVMDDFISYDEKNSVLLGKKSGRRLKVEDYVRARIVAVSFTGGPTGKVGITTRQPFLGKITWIKEETARITRRPAKAEVEGDAGEGESV